MGVKKVVIEYPIHDGQGLKSVHEFYDPQDAIAFLNNLPRMALPKVRFYDGKFKGVNVGSPEDLARDVAKFFNDEDFRV